MLDCKPVDKLSITVTVSEIGERIRTNEEPRKPHPPVTNGFINDFFINLGH